MQSEKELMVFEDISSRKQFPNSRMAPIADRLLSVAVDLALFSPLFSLCMATLLRRLQERYYSSPDSNEFWVLVGMIMFGTLGLAVFTQGMFWSIFGATPGQMFFQIRVVRKGSRVPLTLFSAWLRALLFWIECALIGIPFLEVFSHPDRRVFHDRACESEVITLKAEGASAPHPVETRFVRAIFTAMVSLVMVWSFATFNHVYRQVKNGRYQEAKLGEEGYLCQEVPARDQGSRLDAAIAMFSVGELSSDCLTSEIEFAFWRGESDDQAWASLATAVLNSHDKALQAAYLQQACDKSKESVACGLADWIRLEKTGKLPKAASWTRSVLALAHDEQGAKFEDWKKELDQLPADFDLPEFVESERLKLMWYQKKTAEARGGYEVIWDQLSSSSQKRLATTLCFSELTQDCSVKSYSYCRDLEKTLRKDPPAEVKPEWIVALAEEKSCRKATEPSLVEFVGDLDPESSWGRLVLAVLPESGWSESKRLDELRRIAFGDTSSAILQSRAIVRLLMGSKDPHDFEKAKTAMADRRLPGAAEIQHLMLASKEKHKIELKERLPASAVEDAVQEEN